ncbi:prenyltransferase [candidate division SR1 bacterium Aalborg_AAW-1]|nr:prenyltransferase [candidate division SR1 bacterium Aalborg_AAW-1]
MNFSTLIRISRPRFWHYVLGPMLIYFAGSGYLDEIYSSWSSGGTDWIFQLIILIIILGYFTLPANLWIYGWNDIADGDTDKFNTKKGTYEAKIDNSKTMKNKLKKQIIGRNIGYIIIGGLGAVVCTLLMDCGLYTVPCNPQDIIFGSLHIFFRWIMGSILIGLLPFLLTSYLYSCKPLRAKAKPFIDGIMNVLYIAVPFSIIGVTILSALINRYEIGFNIELITYNFFAALLRCMAMHCYSAIPDIEPDRQAGLTTTAVYLGKQNSLIYCATLYALSAFLSFPTLGWFSIVGGIIYISVMILSMVKKDLFALYKLFPYINLIIGFLLFRYIILYL